MNYPSVVIFADERHPRLHEQVHRKLVDLQYAPFVSCIKPSMVDLPDKSIGINKNMQSMIIKDVDNIDDVIAMIFWVCPISRFELEVLRDYFGKQLNEKSGFLSLPDEYAYLFTSGYVSPPPTILPHREGTIPKRGLGE